MKKRMDLLSRALRMSLHPVIMGGWTPTWLILDKFTSDKAAGSVDGTAAEPGPGTRTGNDSGNALSLSGGYISIDGRTGPADPGHRYGQITEELGLGMLVKARIPSNASYQMRLGTGSSFGWLTGGLAWGTTSGTVGVYVGPQHGILTGLSVGTEVWLACVHNGRTLIMAKNPSDGAWTLGWVIGTSGNRYAIMGVFANPPSGSETVMSQVGVCVLGGPWAEDHGVATDRLEGAVEPNDTFTHEADCLLEFVADTLPTAGSIKFLFRWQDSDNFWRIQIGTTGDLALHEMVDGSPTSRGNSAGAVSAGNRVRVKADDETITVYVGTAQKINYTSAANFKTETDGKIGSEGTGGAITDVTAWPRYITGLARKYLEAACK